MWVLIVLVGHVTLVVSEFTVLSGFGPDLADGGDNPWWGGLEDLDFLGSVNSNLGDKDMTVEQARSYLGLKEGVNYDRKSMRKQYHRVCAKWHPDKNPNNTMAKQYFQKFKMLTNYLAQKPCEMRDSKIWGKGAASTWHYFLPGSSQLVCSWQRFHLGSCMANFLVCVVRRYTLRFCLRLTTIGQIGSIIAKIVFHIWKSVCLGVNGVFN